MFKVSLLLLVGSSLAAAAAPTATTSFGTLVGSHDLLTGVTSFKGVPYARAPVGDLRFAAPANWTAPYAAGQRDARKYGATCVSASQGGGTVSEDCLFLNVFLPPMSKPGANSSGGGGGLATMLFIHGGSFVFGAGSEYDGSALAARHGVAVVTINYRLGAFGWLQTSDANGNRGLQDQRAAIAWVRREGPGAFGLGIEGPGAPGLTIFGESAGAISVNLHLIAPRSAGLFARALMESGLPTAQPHRFATERFANVTAAAGCPAGGGAPGLACLRALSTAGVVAADAAAAPSGGNIFTSPQWGPTVDLDEFSDDPANLMKGGQLHRDVAFAAGSNTDEGWLFIYPSFPAKLSAAGFGDFLRGAITSADKPFNATLYAAVLALYPPDASSGADNRPLASALGADISFVCGARDSVANMVRFADPALRHYLYHFAVTNSAGLSLHASELPFVWDEALARDTPARAALATAMGGFWSAFARGDAAGMAGWPAYDTADTNALFDVPYAAGATETGRRKVYCDFWAAQTNASPMEVAALRRTFALRR
jgi:carboxylesterase type B